MARLPALSAMGVEELLKLREEVMAMLSRRATALQGELAALEGYQRSDGPPSSGPRTIRRSGPRTSSLFGRKIPPKYRDQSGNAWSGRGAQPRWLTAAIKAGAKREDFLIDNSGRAEKRAASATRLGSSKRGKSAKRAKSARRTRPAKRAKSATRPKSAKRPTAAQRSKSVSRAKSAKVSKPSRKRVASRTTLRTKSRPPSPRSSPMSDVARQNGAGSQTGDAGRADQP